VCKIKWMGDAAQPILADLTLLCDGEGNVVLFPTALGLGQWRSEALHGVKAAADVPSDIGPVEDHLQIQWSCLYGSL
jgi:hypothetical protein